MVGGKLRMLVAGGLLVAAFPVLIGCGERANGGEPRPVATEDPGLSEAEARVRCIKADRERLQAELRANGGWRGWYEKLDPFCKDMLELVKAARKEDKEAKVVSGKGGQLAPLEGLLRQCADLRSLGQTDGAAAKDWSSVTTTVDLSNQLWGKGIDLIVVPIPAKFELLPEEFSDSVPESTATTLVRHRYMLALLEQDVEVIDIFPALAAAKAQGEAVYLATDSHWTDQAMRIAAGLIAERIERYEAVRDHARVDYKTEEVVYRYRSPLLKGFLTPEEQEAFPLVEDPALRIIDITGEPYDAANHPYSPVLLFGDSYMMTKRPGSTFAAHLA
ncbi:MAG TPA: hypothetical protein ENN80_00555, partial [Candidatus Hydrogenedentes bacterium]|nr:hypothetical protein [Candidatus Hydrogenedentota bacterium]